MSSVPASSISHNASPNSMTWRAALDLMEKVILLGFYGSFMIPVVAAFIVRLDVGAGLLAVSESLVVILVLFRKPAQSLSQRPLDWLLAFGATISPTLVRPLEADPSVLSNFAPLLMFAGICYQIAAKAVLGRRFGIVAANRGICCQGPYRIVRHPIYMGYFITHIGFLLAAPTWWNLAIYAMTYSFMIPRIFAEERLLRRDDEYEAYCGKVRWRLFPGLL
ncbi:MAG: isoprenylcysteine carboxylmethyltransferase family protein [Pirellulales bacterium]